MCFTQVPSHKERTNERQISQQRLITTQTSRDRANKQQRDEENATIKIFSHDEHFQTLKDILKKM